MGRLRPIGYFHLSKCGISRMKWLECNILIKITNTFARQNPISQIPARLVDFVRIIKAMVITTAIKPPKPIISSLIDKVSSMCKYYEIQHKMFLKFGLKFLFILENTLIFLLLKVNQTFLNQRS